MRFTQVLVGAAPGDAITRSALEIDRIVAPAADTSLRARYIDPALAGIATPLDEPDSCGPPSAEDILLLHVSIGEPDVSRWLDERPERLVLLYHNISPAQSFEADDPAFADLLLLGRAELPALAERAVMSLADSEFNAAELRTAGAGDVRVCPLVFDPLALAGTEPDPSTVAHLDGLAPGPVVLFVGQLLPHKRVDWLLEAYFILVTYLIPEARLIIVGPSPLPRYRRRLQAFVDELNLSRSWLAGRVSDPALAAFYGHADVVVTASEHEGFCAPLLEAMAFDVPVVARRFGAVPETLGDAGLLLEPGDSPAVFAEVLAELIADPDRFPGPTGNDPVRAAALRRALIERGRLRIGAIGPAVARATIRRHLADVLPDLGSEEPPDAVSGAQR